LRFSTSFRDAYRSLATTLIPNNSEKIVTQPEEVQARGHSTNTLSNYINKPPICLKKLRPLRLLLMRSTCICKSWNRFKIW